MNLVFGPATFVTGWSPIVFVTTPPHPESKARMRLVSVSGGGADDSRKGFSNVSPLNITDRLAGMGSSKTENWGIEKADHATVAGRKNSTAGCLPYFP